MQYKQFILTISLRSWVSAQIMVNNSSQTGNYSYVVTVVYFLRNRWWPIFACYRDIICNDRRFSLPVGQANMRCSDCNMAISIARKMLSNKLSMHEDFLSIAGVYRRATLAQQRQHAPSPLQQHRRLHLQVLQQTFTQISRGRSHCRRRGGWMIY